MPCQCARWRIHVALDDAHLPKIIPSSESWLRCIEEDLPHDCRELVTNAMITTACEAGTTAASPQNLGDTIQASLPGWIAGLLDESLGHVGQMVDDARDTPPKLDTANPEFALAYSQTAR
jgi:hypothetical protein